MLETPAPAGPYHDTTLNVKITKCKPPAEQVVSAGPSDAAPHPEVSEGGRNPVYTRARTGND